MYNFQMIQEGIIEGNKIIAKFMGVKLGVDLYSWRPGVTDPIQEHNLQYHSSWDWLMPVVEKIENLGYASAITKQPLSDEFKCHFNEEFLLKRCGFGTSKNSKIEAVYNAIVEFIKWYNQNNIQK